MFGCPTHARFFAVANTNDFHNVASDVKRLHALYRAVSGAVSGVPGGTGMSHRRAEVARSPRPENMVSGETMNSTQAEAVSSKPSGPAFEVKGTIAPVTVLCLRTVDVARVERELAA